MTNEFTRLSSASVDLSEMISSSRSASSVGSGFSEKVALVQIAQKH